MYYGLVSIKHDINIIGLDVRICNLFLMGVTGKVVEYDEPMKLIKEESSLFGQLVKEYWLRSGNGERKI